jgi:hypothetical protein
MKSGTHDSNIPEFQHSLRAVPYGQEASWEKLLTKAQLFEQSPDKFHPVGFIGRQDPRHVLQ